MRLVRGQYVLTGERVLRQAAVLISNGKIEAVGSYDELSKQYPQADVLGSDQHWIMPGLVNAHHHSNGVSNLLQGIDDDFLEPWLLNIIHAMRSQEPKKKTLYSIAMLLQSGVTSVVDVAATGGSKEDCTQNFQACLDAYEQAGMRVAFTAGVTFNSHLAHNQDEEFVASLPSDLREQVKTHMPLSYPGEITPDEYLDMMTDLVKRYQENDQIDVWFGPPGPQWVGDDLLVKISQAARQLGTQVQTHAMESYSEKLVGPRFHGKTMVSHLKDLGVLSPQFSIAHGTWTTAEDMKILREQGAAISHNPSSNLRLRAGVAPLNALLEAGVTMGLGMDGTAIGDDECMFSEMRLAARLHRTPQFGSPAPTYEQIFAMATTGGAKLMGKADQIGKLEPGYKADMVLVKTNRITRPWVAPEVNPLHLLLLRAKAVDVDTVLVGGQVVLQDGLPTNFDLRQVEQELAAQLDAQPVKQQHLDLVAALRPYLVDWYTNWDQPTLEPYAAFNSKT
eukprot:scaffold24022_cov168-Amphora_coffeaeformis.AAC.1